jgi:uncharacterized protein
MRINVAQLLKEQVGASRSCEVEEEQTNLQGQEGVHSLRGQIALLRTDKGVLVTGLLEGKTSATCSRCLSPFEFKIKLDIREEYFPIVEINSGLALSEPDDTGAFTIDANHILDTDEAVRQYSLVATPMKPLCHDDCAGLCPVCGKNLNTGSCNCQLNSTRSSSRTVLCSL